MNASSKIPLPRTVQPPRDIFSQEGKANAGSCFLRIGDRYSSFLEPMEPSERIGIYMDEIPMGRTVLYDMEHVRSWYGDGEARDPEFRISDAEYWRPPVGSWVVIYESDITYSLPSLSEKRSSHYRLSQSEALDDAEAMSKARNWKVAVGKVLDLIDWH